MRRKILTFNRMLLILSAVVVALFVLSWFRFSSPSQGNPFEPTASSTPKLKTPVPSSSPKPTARPTNNPIPSDGSYIIKGVPFTPQAPFGNWSDQRQEDGCEEASTIMAVRWFRGQSLTLQQAETEILKISDYEQEKYGTYHDTSPADTVNRIFKDYLNYHNVKAVSNISLPDDIKNELRKGYLVLVQVDGQVLQNPYYTPPGPDRHMLVITGYDTATQEFITNDPGTKRGQNYRYSEYQLWEAMRDYPTGNHLPITEFIRSMIVVMP